MDSLERVIVIQKEVLRNIEPEKIKEAKDFYNSRKIKPEQSNSLVRTVVIEIPKEFKENKHYLKGLGYSVASMVIKTCYDFAKEIHLDKMEIINKPKDLSHAFRKPKENEKLEVTGDELVKLSFRVEI